MFFELLVFAIGLGLAITIHEAAHCFVAYWLGDPTPKVHGRLNLNPSTHLDPLGYFLPLALYFLGSPLIFGWGKPSPYDPYNFKFPKRDTLLVALAGPVSNLLIATLLSLPLRFASFPISPGILIFLISLNIGLALFNLIPVPPLDGSKILSAFLSPQQSYQFEAFTKQNSSLLLLMLIFPIFGGRSLASLIISPLFQIIYNFLV